MKIKFKAKGHKNISSLHKSTFEITQDTSLTPSGDCIVGVASELNLNSFSKEFKDKIANDKTKIVVKLKTENGHDEISGFGHPKLTLTHPTDIVARKSSFICSRTLMVKADKVATDLDRNLINDLKQGNILSVEIILK
ncbi:DUF371 domain-containing protein [Methanobrevibacter curvatus]|uniref:DUF371 domain-containing protein n=1 Tax=Methanobrevibacter curvatus TaxID=49547 RepID=A0A166C479_9EURY|nr:DUF371 domain-containing protein [Methanobrevibacter curvatus]KZX14111.1 hypothetical protein MBCUR_06380 [Methanobrevibacter curvatus]